MRWVTAATAARLGLRTMFVTSVGNDDGGKRILADLAREGIDISRIPVREGCGSPMAYCWIDSDGKRSVAWTHNGLRLLSAEEVPCDVIAGAKMLHLDGHHPEAALAAARCAKENGVLFNFDAGTIRPGVEQLVELADLLIASEYFARTFTGEQDLDRALLKLAKYQAKVTGITLGAGGSIFLDNGEIRRFPIFPAPVVDTTGAGDSFHAGFAFKYLQTQDIAEWVGAHRRNGCKLVGFALETENELENARSKMERKGLDMIVLNSMRESGAGFGYDTNKIKIISRGGEVADFPLKSKREVSTDIFDAIEKLECSKD